MPNPVEAPVDGPGMSNTVAVGWGRKTAPAGNRGLTTSPAKES